MMYYKGAEVKGSLLVIVTTLFPFALNATPLKENLSNSNIFYQLRLIKESELAPPYIDITGAKPEAGSNPQRIFESELYPPAIMPLIVCEYS